MLDAVLRYDALLRVAAFDRVIAGGRSPETSATSGDSVSRL